MNSVASGLRFLIFTSPTLTTSSETLYTAFGVFASCRVAHAKEYVGGGLAAVVLMVPYNAFPGVRGFLSAIFHLYPDKATSLYDYTFL